MKRWAGIVLTLIMIFAFCACGSTAATVKDKTEQAGFITWDTAFSEAGFTAEEIECYREVLDTVGVTDFHDVTIIDNDPFTIVHGKIYDSENLQLNLTLENHKIIYVELAGIPDTKTEAYLNWRGKIKWKKVDTKKAVDLYSDTEGGYLAVLDWRSKTIAEYEG